MDRINEFDLEPGVYKNGGNYYVVTEIVTHQFHSAEALPEALVVFRDLSMAVGRVNGAIRPVHKRYQLAINEFRKQFEPLR